MIVHKQQCYGVPRALLILEAQAHLSTFLSDFVNSLLVNTDGLTTGPSLKEPMVLDFLPEKIRLTIEDSGMRFSMSYYNVRTASV